MASSPVAFPGSRHAALVWRHLNSYGFHFYDRQPSSPGFVREGLRVVFLAAREAIPNHHRDRLVGGIPRQSFRLVQDGMINCRVRRTFVLATQDHQFSLALRFLDHSIVEDAPIPGTVRNRCYAEALRMEGKNNASSQTHRISLFESDQIGPACR